jgi:hypothetical protein
MVPPCLPPFGDFGAQMCAQSDPCTKASVLVMKSATFLNWTGFHQPHMVSNQRQQSVASQHFIEVIFLGHSF